MRNAKFFGSVMVVLFLTNALFATPGNKKVEKEESVAHLQIKLEDENYLFISGEGKLVITPSANFLKTYKFQLTDAEMAQIDFGYYPNKIVGVSLTLESGEYLVGAGFLNKSGNLSFTLHGNGAGGDFPKGWGLPN